MPNRKQDLGRVIAITVLAVLAGGAGLVGYLQADPQQQEPDRYYYRTSAGAVLFTHTDHQDRVDECETCHHELLTGEEDPLGCRSCHPTQPPEAPPFLGCRECHDEPDYTVDFAEHEDLLDIHELDCTDCHVPRSVTDTFHSGCSDCHLQGEAARFADLEGKVLCQSCHLK